jgi:alanine dehydrogenase
MLAAAPSPKPYLPFLLTPMKIGLIKEGKIPADNRVALIPSQCRWIQSHRPDWQIIAQSSPSRCYTDAEYARAGVTVQDNLDECDVLLGIKEVLADQLIPDKTYLFFSHTKKLQLHNRPMFRAALEKNITLIDYECLEHTDGQRIIGFGFFAGIVGAHNGMMAYGNRTGSFHLGRVHESKDYRELIHTYFGLKLPNVKMVVTGSGRVAHGVIEVMNLMGVTEVEPDEYLERQFDYPVYVQLKGADLYTHTENKTYKRTHFHEHPEEYRSRFLPYTHCTDVLMNGVYWDETVPRLFERQHVQQAAFTIQTIADITDDTFGSIPINLGDQTIMHPVYGVDKTTLEKTEPYLPNSVDVMAVGNLPNELPRDASRYFGEQLIKYILDDIEKPDSAIIQRATMVKNGKLAAAYDYMKEYAGLEDL